nr:MAG TPA: hypothetical protein [Caudoviricetes sp.]
MSVSVIKSPPFLDWYSLRILLNYFHVLSIYMPFFFVNTIVEFC